MIKMDGGNVKQARQAKSAAVQATAVGESREEVGVGAAAASMGLLKRKRTTPPESPAPSKKRASEDAELPKPSSSEHQQHVEGTPPRKIQAGKSFSSSEEARASSKQVSGQNDELGTEGSARLRFEKDVDALQNRVPAVVENVSYGQESLFRARHPPEASGPTVALTKDCEAQLSATPHLVPSHAGWFQWERIHQLERAALPEYFAGKDTKKTPAIYIEQRTCIMKKYRENPRKLLKFEDVRDLLTRDVSCAVRLFGFLDHWGLINYQAITEFSPFLSRGPPGSLVETNGALSASPLVKPALANLFNFEAPALAPAQKPLAISPSASNLPISSLAEAAVQESLAAPDVEYHCNSCQADCSKRRYHCQKQADFDLCPDCYNDGKFGHGMSGTDFLRMDALTETADANGGGWSDQETLLLLEALELYGDNWTEIAEHVATKSKAQCILHFIRLPIEDPFLEDMEASSSLFTVRPPATGVSDNQSTSPPKDKVAQTKTVANELSSSSEPLEAAPSSFEQDASVLTETGKKDRPSENKTEEAGPSSPKQETKDEADLSKVVSKANDSSDVHPLVAASECAGCAGPDGLIAFADAGNPVMTQVAFLAAMVGPRVAAAAAAAALKSLAEDDPVGFLSVKNSFALDGSETSETTLTSGCAKRASGQQSNDLSLVSSFGGPTVASEGKSNSKGADEETKKNADEKAAPGILEKVAGQDAQAIQKSEGPTNSLVSQQVAPSIAKVRTAAANALASAAVKAKLLADQEEREIQRLVAGVIENQLKKLELKLKQFGELESMLGKECEQAEKARAKVYAERARIMASRLGSSASVGQLPSTVSTAASYPKTVSHPVNIVAQPRPAVFTFGPTGHSAPAGGYATTTRVEVSSSMPASTSSQQGITQTF